MPPTPFAPPPLSPLKASVRALADKINDLDTFASDAGDVRFKNALEQSIQLFDQLRNLVNKSKSGTIADFFDAVGSGVIAAQNRLDVASAAYVRNALRLDAAAATATGSSGAAAAAPPTMGAMFRIPRVTAELKCSLEMDHEKGLNVIFYSERNDVRELHQQTVQLEIVAVPVPPDYINYLRSQPADKPAGAVAGAASDGPLALVESDDEWPPPGLQPLSHKADEGAALSFDPPQPPPPSAPDTRGIAGQLGASLVDGAARDEVRVLIEKLDAKKRRKTGRQHSAVSQLLLPLWSRALVFSDQHNAHFILLAVTDKRPRLLLWQLVLRPSSLRLLYELASGEKSQLKLGRLQRFFSRLSKAAVCEPGS